MATMDGPFAAWLSQAGVRESRLNPDQVGVLKAAYHFRESCGEDYYSTRILSRFLLHAQTGLEVAKIARLLKVSRPSASRQQGIPILQGLRIAKDSTGNLVLTRAIDQAADNLTHGQKLAAPLSASPHFPRDIVEMIAVGEESNQLEKILDIALALEKRTARQLELFVRLLEPLMLLVMAVVTLVVVAALLLPIFKMSSVAS
jgi:type II secretory pathway component PulF